MNKLVLTMIISMVLSPFANASRAGTENSGGSSGWIKYSYYFVQFDDQTASISQGYNPPNLPNVIAENLSCESGVEVGLDVDLFCYEKTQDADGTYLSVTVKGQESIIQKHFRTPNAPEVVATLKCKSNSLCFQERQLWSK